MGTERIPRKVKLIVGLISSDKTLFERAKTILEKKLRNEVDFESGIIDFTHTNYYEEEMGLGLKRRFVAFRKLVDLKGLYRVKLLTNRIESHFSVAGRRRINLDPGYMDLSKIVLFSTKDYTHRIYLDKGIYAEVTLFFRDKKFECWPWTYPDFRTGEYIEELTKIRQIYKTQIQAL